MRDASRRVTKEEETAICEDLKNGLRPSEVALKTGFSKRTIINVGNRNGLDLSSPRTKAATKALMDYEQTKRCELLNKFFNRIDEKLDEELSARDLKEISVALGVGIDKRRLEDGEATTRRETRDTTNAREQVASRLTKLSERSGKSGVS